MKIKHLLLGMLAMAAAVACKQDEPVEEPKLDVDKTAVALQATAGEATFAVTSNQNWVATADADWVSMDPASGAASEKAVTVKVTADDNTTTEARTATVTVKAGALTKTVAVTQAAGAGETPENPEKPELTASDWAIVGSFTGGWNPAEGISLYVLDENYFVLYGLELEEGAQWKFLQGGSWGGAEVGADRTSVEPNTIQAKGGTNIYVNTPGKYDIYLAADATKYYVMSEGKTPAEATEPSAAVKTYTVTGTIQNSNWDNMGAAGLMTKEGDYYVAKNVPFVTAKELYDGADQVEFKVCNTGSWDGAYGAPDAAPYQVNAEIPVQTENAQNIALAAATGTYDVYFDEANAKVWVMEAGFKPGEKEPVAPADIDIDGKQWQFTWQVMGGVPSLIDLGVTMPGVAILAVDGGAFDTALAGVYVPYIAAEYTIAKTNGTSGVVTLTAEGQSVEIPYSNATETTVHLASAAFLYEDIDCTLAASKIDIMMEEPEPEPEGPQAITVAEFLALEVSTTEYQLTGVIEGTYNTTYGNFYLNDGTGKVLVYGLTATPQTSNDKSFASLGLRDGDTLTLIGQRADYNGTAQVGGPAYYVSHVAAPYVDFATSSASVDAEVTTYSIEVKSNTAWTATASEGVTLDKTSGEGDATVVMTFAANTAADAVNHTVTFACEGATATFSLTQKAVPAAGEKVVFEESFAKSSGTMGWDGTNGNGTFTADNTGWTVENAYGAGGSAKFGTSSKKGKATTPALSLTGTATLTFKAGAWNNGSEATTLKLSMTGGTLSVTSVTLKKGEWTEYEVTITDATEGAKITFEASTASKNRFFLDDIKIVQAQ